MDEQKPADPADVDDPIRVIADALQVNQKLVSAWRSIMGVGSLAGRGLMPAAKLREILERAVQHVAPQGCGCRHCVIIRVGDYCSQLLHKMLAPVADAIAAAAEPASSIDIQRTDGAGALMVHGHCLEVATAAGVKRYVPIERVTQLAEPCSN